MASIALLIGLQHLNIYLKCSLIFFNFKKEFISVIGKIAGFNFTISKDYLITKSLYCGNRLKILE